MCRRKIMPEVNKPNDEPVFLIDFPDWESSDSDEPVFPIDFPDWESRNSDERMILNFAWNEPIALDSDGEPIYKDSLNSEGASDDDSIITMFHWTIDVLHIDELFAIKCFDLHYDRVHVEFYYQEVRITVDNELIATLDRNLLCHEESWDDDTAVCTWCGESQGTNGSRIFARFDYMHEEQLYYKRKYYYFDD
ncbi:hypothetical protein TKK_0017632 [Trichogramma kaykai]|uniref:Uncharacterized protein n=1 Tax=Trichogramma kaykai TaxID=54128 RepID=A0ABD2W217_9HYME